MNIKTKYFTSSLIFVLASTLLCGCHSHDQFSIEGTISNSNGRSLYIEELTPNGTVFLDSISIASDGRFKYSAALTYQTFFNLHSSPVDYVVLLPEAGEHIILTGCFDSLQTTYETSGSIGSTLLWQLQDYTNDGIRTLIDLVERDKANRDRFGVESDAYKNAKQETDSIFRDAFQAQVEYMSQFIQEHNGSLASLIALYKEFNQQPIITPEYNLDYYEEVLSGLEATLPDNPHTVHFKNTVERLRHQYGKKNEALDMVFDGE